MNKQNSPTLSFLIDKDNIPVFFSILQQGFMISVKVGCSLKSLLCDQLGVESDYLSGRISTIFLNGKPVDDVESAMINKGDTLALSAAMPGLVGATFRKGGILSIFRSAITHKNETDSAVMSTQGMITLKLFNLLVSEMGPAFMERGFWITVDVFCDFMESKKEQLQMVYKSVKINGQVTGLEELKNLKNNDNQKLIHVFVQIEK